MHAHQNEVPFVIPPKVKRFLAVITSLSIASIAFFQYLNHKVATDRQHLSDRLVQMDISGTRPPVPGPYLAAGNASELTFKAVDLGPATAIQMSEQGDVLFRNPHGNTMRLVHPFGQIETYPPGKSILLFPSGKTRIGSEIIKPNNEGTIQQFRPAEEGIYSDSHFGCLRHSANPPGSENKILFDDDTQIEVLASSSSGLTYGTVETTGFWAKTFPEPKMAVIHDDKVQIVKLPKECSDPWIFASSNSCYLSTSSLRGTQFLWEYKDGQFAKLPVIPNTARQVLVSANSKKDFLLEIDPASRTAASIRFQPFYVSQGKYFPVSDIVSNLGLRLVRVAGQFGPLARFMDENGDFVITAQQNGEEHLYLLKRA